MDRERYSRPAKKLNLFLAAGAGVALLACNDKESNPTEINNLKPANTIDIATIAPTDGPQIVPVESLPNTIQSELKRDNGEWTQHEIAGLASSMLKEEYEDISKAGEIIADMLGENPNLSRENKLFKDDLITIKNIDDKNNGNTPALAYSLFKPVDQINFNFIEAQTGNIHNTTSESKLLIEGIEFNTNETEDLSDFAIKFLVAAQLKRTESVAMISEFIYTTDYVNEEQSEEEKNAIDILELKHSNITLDLEGKDRINALTAASFFSQYLMTPTFLEAAENGEFTNKDLEILKFYFASAEYLVQNQAFIKEGDNYKLNSDKQKVIAVMARLALSQTNQIRESSSSNTRTY